MQLKINNIEADLINNISFNKVGFVLENWLSKQITFSKTVKIAKSDLLDKLFLRPQNLEIKSNSFAKYYNFEVSEFGQIVYQGIAILISVTQKKDYEIQLLDSSYILFKNLNNDLNKLNFESSDFVFNSTSYANLKDVNGSVWLWAVANFHEKRTYDNNILSGNLAFSRPFFSVKKIFEKMFENQKWNYKLNGSTSFIEKLLLTSNADNFYFCSYEKSFDGNFNSDLDFDNYSFLKNDTVSGSILKLHYDTSIRIRGYITSQNDTSIIISGVSSGGADSQKETLTINKGTHFYDFTSNEFVTDDTIYNIQIELTGILDFDNVLIYTKIQESSFGDISDVNFLDFKVKTFDNLPEIKQIDLFKNSLTTVAGFFNSKNLQKKINVHSLTDVSNLSAIDFSKKLIQNTLNIETLKGYGKENLLQYSNENNLGQGNFAIYNETYTDKKVVYKSIFRGSKEVNIDNINMLDIPIYNDIDRISFETSLSYFEQKTNYTVARFEQLNGNTLLSKYYDKLINSLKKGKLVTANFDLSKTDFLTFDFTRLIYLEQQKSNFWVLEIQNYIKGKTTKLKLLKY